MHSKCLVLVMVAFVCYSPASAFAQIEGSTSYTLDLTKPKEVLKKATWADPSHINVTTDGLGWGTSEDTGSRDFWLQTEPIGIGESWRPTSIAMIKATVDRPGTSGMLYARYSADGKNWTTWQYLETAVPARDVSTSTFRGTLRVPGHGEGAYHKLRLDYSRRDDVPWGSDEEALVKEILTRDPKYFEKSTPFIGYVQFLYEAQLSGGQRVKSLTIQTNWWLSGKHRPPKDEKSRKDRDEVWRFRAL